MAKKNDHKQIIAETFLKKNTLMDSIKKKHKKKVQL